MRNKSPSLRGPQAEATSASLLHNVAEVASPRPSRRARTRNDGWVGNVQQTLALAIFLAVFALPASAAIKTPQDKFVRTANYFLKAGTDIRPSDYPGLAKYDLLVLPAEAQTYNADAIQKIRQLNPTIIILAYVPTKSYNFGWVDPIHKKLLEGIDDSWWLLSPAGKQISVWPNTAVLNGVGPWHSYLPQFVYDRIWSTGLWDGIFYDEFSTSASWMNSGDIDVQRDGVKDDPTLVDIAWKRGMVNMLKTTRDLLGNDAVIVTNGDSTDDVQHDVNGRMFESFPTPWEASGTWSGVMASYLRLHALVGHPPVMIINTNTGGTGNDADYKKMRYGLTSTLLGDGFFSFDFGESDHGQLWHYDEEDVRLGKPVGNAVNVTLPTDRRVRPSVWRRDFENGIALVNASGVAQTVQFKEEFEKVHGVQDPQTNDGSIVSSVTLPSNDGLILLKRIQHLTGSAFPNGGFVRLFDTNGEKTRNGFFAYEAPFDGAAMVAVKDLDGDGHLERIVAGKTSITLYKEDGSRVSSFAPYGQNYTLGINFALGDLDGDGREEIVTGTSIGGGPQVRIFKADGTPAGPGFFAFDPSTRGGVTIALGDLYGTGKQMIIAGAGAGETPQVRVFTKTGRVTQTEFLAYDYRFRGGVRVAAGDLDGDGKAEIVTGAGSGGGPHVRIWSGSGRSWGKGFFVGDPNSRGGVTVAVTNTANKGKNQIAALTTDVFQFSTTRIKVK